MITVPPGVKQKVKWTGEQDGLMFYAYIFKLICSDIHCKEQVHPAVHTCSTKYKLYVTLEQLSVKGINKEQFSICCFFVNQWKFSWKKNWNQEIGYEYFHYQQSLDCSLFLLLEYICFIFCLSLIQEIKLDLMIKVTWR